MNRLLPLAILAITACSSNLGPPLGPPQEVTVPVGQTIQVQGLFVTFTKVVQDSRCPMGALCIRNCVCSATIELALAAGGGADTVADLTTGWNPMQTLEYAGHTVELVRLEPYPRPGQTISPDDYTATLQVGSLPVPLVGGVFPVAATP